MIHRAYALRDLDIPIFILIGGQHNCMYPQSPPELVQDRLHIFPCLGGCLTTAPVRKATKLLKYETLTGALVQEVVPLCSTAQL